MNPKRFCAQKDEDSGLRRPREAVSRAFPQSRPGETATILCMTLRLAAAGRVSCSASAMQIRFRPHTRLPAARRGALGMPSAEPRFVGPDGGRHFCRPSRDSRLLPSDPDIVRAGFLRRPSADRQYIQSIHASASRVSSHNRPAPCEDSSEPDQRPSFSESGSVLTPIRRFGRRMAF